MSMNRPQRRVPPQAETRTWRRPMKGWYNRNAFYGWYMAREATCVFVGYYALLLICAFERLGAGEAAFTHFMQALAAPGWIVFHGIVFVAFVYHAWTWFAVMPKTMPFVFIGGKRVADARIVSAGALAAIGVSLAILAFFWLTRP